MSLKMRWLGTACFEMLLPDKNRLIIDPYVDDSVSSPISSNEFDGCDYIFVTHGHYDHVLDIGKLARRFSPVIYCSKTTARSLEKHLSVAPNLIRTITQFDTIDTGNMTVDVVPGIHVDIVAEYSRLSRQDAIKGDIKKMDFSQLKKMMRVIMETDWMPDRIEEWMAHFPPGEQLNFVFSIPGCPVIYMAGTFPSQDIKKNARHINADITLLQVLTGNSLKGMEKATMELAIASGCKTVVPQHHDLLLKGAVQTDLTILKQMFEKENEITFQEFVPGKWYEL